MPKKRKKRDIQKDLAKIYKGTAGKVSDMSKLDRKEKKIKKKILLILVFSLAVLGAAAWAGLFYFNQFFQSGSRQVEINISAPKELASGDLITYTIDCANLEKTKLTDGQLNLHYPQGFNFISAEPQPNNDRNRSWDLGDIKKGETKKIKIKGRLIGQEDSAQLIAATLSFVPSNFSSEFQESTSFITTIKSSVLNLKIDGPNQISLDEEVEYKIKYSNKSAKNLGNIKIKAIYPQNFNLQSEEPASDNSDAEKNENIWLIESLEPDEEKEIAIKGKFPSQTENSDDETPIAVGENQKLEAQIGFQNKEDKFIAAQEKNLDIEIIEKSLIVNLLINESPDERVVNFGDTLDYSIIYQNKTSSTMNDLEIEAILATTSINERTILDWNNISDKYDGDIEGQQLDPENRAGIITWDENKIPKLSSLEPDEGGTINFQIEILDYESLPENQITDFDIKNLIKVKVGGLEDTEESYEIESNKITLSVNTDINLQAYGRYYDDQGEPMGSGPIPPQAGKATTYKIYWTLSNTLHEISDVEISTILPDNVIWSDETNISAGQIDYNQNTDKITWQINKIPAGLSNLQASFFVQITPAEDDLGEILYLTDDIELKATDNETDVPINQTLSAISTDLEGDPVAEGKGIVIGSGE